MALALVLVILLQSCNSKTEIPHDHAGVVTHNGQSDPTVLTAGEHVIGYGSKVILYDVRSTRLDLDVDFLFSDASEGKIKLAMQFYPIADSLPAFYEKYQSIHVAPIVDQGVRKAIRGSLGKYTRDEAEETLRKNVMHAIVTESEVVKYLVIEDLEIVNLQY